VIDYSYGIASSIFPNILGKLGTDVVSLNAYIDRTRLTRSREEFRGLPACIEHRPFTLERSRRTARCRRGKGVLADESGNFLDEDREATVITKCLLEAGGNCRANRSKRWHVRSASSEMDILAERTACRSCGRRTHTAA
jgi:hypothetical protein